MSDIALHIVPTPIGNLADITLRALEVLKSADVILAEDTRTSRVLLNHYNIDRPLQSYHIFNEHQAVAQLIDRMKKGERFALISDAGTPGISDPGFLLVRETLKAGLTMDCLPGPTAFIPALIKSGFPTDRFVFEGFLPHKKGRQTALKQLAHEPRTVVLYESPHRLKRLLEELSEHVGTERMISVSRELTKKFEETVTGSVRDVQACFADRDVKGELVIVIHGEEN
jgi:16S rRNA (cytidine1402-2'-O)-methyltransferase